MDTTLRPLRLGTPVRFTDRWVGTVSAMDVTEDWEVINLYVTSGVLFWRNSVKLPFSAASQWTREMVAMDCDSVSAFRRQVPPVAAPARPLSAETPTSLAGASLSGALVRPSDRRVGELLVRHAGEERRVPVAGVAFEGKTLTIGAQVENAPLYRADEDIWAEVRQALSEDRLLLPDDRRSLAVEVANGVVHLQGNVRKKEAKERAEQVAAALPGVVGVRNDVVDDLSLEQTIAQALERAGLFRDATVQARSALGEVTLFGRAASARVADEVLRVASGVPGVRGVRNRIESGPADRIPSGSPAAL